MENENFLYQDIEKINELILELWEIGYFDEDAYNLITKFVRDNTQNLTQDTIAKLLPLEEVFYLLATSRNRKLITSQQQAVLRKHVVGIFGLSVGSHAAVTWMMESRARNIKLADPDIICGSNLNRIRSGWETIGKAKVEVCKDELLRVNPYASVYTLEKTDKNAVLSFFSNEPKISLVVDAIDDLESKVYLRQLARRYKIPLVSAADVGDNVILDIERYDTDNKLPLFLGRMGNIEHVDFAKLSTIERKKLIIKLVGFEANSYSLLQSLLAIGKDVPTWPQLGATASIAGGLVTTTIKKLVLGETVRSGRYILSIDDLLTRETKTEKINKEKLVDEIKNRLEIYD